MSIPEDQAFSTPGNLNIVPPEVLAYYEEGKEYLRLMQGTSMLEAERTREIISRYLPAPPATVLDIGGGSGPYALWLARQGYEVHLLDAVPLHIEQARQASQVQPDAPIASFTVGDARHLPYPEDCAGALLMLGPLYHLTERNERILALAEARKVLQPGGVLIAAGISRFASTLDGLFGHLLDDPAYVPVFERDLADGQHRNPPGHDYFTTAYLHLPDDLRAEVEEAGFACEAVLGVEGPGWLLHSFVEQWRDMRRREQIMDVARRLEQAPSVLGMSAHLIAIGRKQGL